MKLTFDGVITSRHTLKIFRRKTFDTALLTFKPDDLVTLTLAKARKDRTLPQNAWYWGVIVKMLADYFGYETNEMHEELKRLFNAKPSKVVLGDTYPGTTTTLTTTEFSDYCERIIRWAAMEFQIVIPSPDEIEL